jgi:hypothetical protein
VKIVSENIGPSGPSGNGGAVAVQQSYPVSNGWAVDLVSPTEDGAAHLDITTYATCGS